MSNISIANAESGLSVRTKLNYLFDKARNGVHVWDYMSATQRANAASFAPNNDITAAINAAIADVPSTGGRLILPLGRTYTQGGHTLPMYCDVLGYGKASLSVPEQPMAGCTFLESGVDGATVFTFQTAGSIRAVSLIDTIIGTRTSGDAIVAISGDLLQCVNTLDCLFFGFWNGSNNRVSNGSIVRGNHFIGTRNICVIMDNEVSADAGDTIVADNICFPGYTGKTAAAAIYVRNGDAGVVNNRITKNAGNCTNGIIADIRNGTGQFFAIGNKVENVDAEPCIVQYTNTPDLPVRASDIIVMGNVFKAGGTASPLKMRNLTTFMVGGNTLTGGAAAAIDTGGTCSAGTFFPNTNNGNTANLDASALANGTKNYWDANPLFVGDSTTDNGVRLTASSGGLSVSTAFSNTATDFTAGKLFIQGTNPSRPSDTDSSFAKTYHSKTSGNAIVYNSAGTNYGVFGVQADNSGWYWGTSNDGKTNITAKSHAWDQSGNLIVYPKASVTPANNGDMAFELTSNTTLKIKVKGSDGTVRSVSLTLA